MIQFVSNIGTMTRKKMKDLRESAGMSQRELAEMISYSQASICRWETGEQNIPDRAATLIEIMTIDHEALEV